MPWTNQLKNRQLVGKYSSLINSIAISLLLCLVLIYVGGGMFRFLENVMINVFGYTVFTDFIHLVLTCILDFMMCYLPVKLFKCMHAGAYSETYMPVEKKIVSKKTVLPLFLFGIAAGFLAYVLTIAISNSFADYSGNNDDYLWRIGLKYNYQIFFYIINVAVIPAITEELYCRKALCSALAPYGQKTAIIVSSVVFSLLHANFYMFLHTFVVGLIAGWLYVGTKNIKISMAFHFVFNLLSVIGTLIQYRVSEDAAITFMVGRAIISFFVFAFCLVYLIHQRKMQIKDEEIEAAVEGRYDEYMEKKRKYAHQLEMLPGEDGEEVIPLKRREKTKEFFSPLMILFIACTLIIAVVKIIQ